MARSKVPLKKFRSDVRKLRKAGLTKVDPKKAKPTRYMLSKIKKNKAAINEVTEEEIKKNFAKKKRALIPFNRKKKQRSYVDFKSYKAMIEFMSLYEVKRGDEGGGYEDWREHIEWV
jgi:hypothetical protein